MASIALDIDLKLKSKKMKATIKMDKMIKTVFIKPKILF